MTLVIIGGTGLIGAKVVHALRRDGFPVVAASPESGVNPLTGEGLTEVLTGAATVVDVSSSSSVEDTTAGDFFVHATRNLLAAERAEGVMHHVLLSVVGSARLAESSYFRAQGEQEQLIVASGVPFTIVHATHSFELLDRIAGSATQGDTVRVPPVLVQPMAADDVANAVAQVAVGYPVNGIVEVAGPEQLRLDSLLRRRLGARRDPRVVIADAQARYLGATLGEHSLVPSARARIGLTRFEDWLSTTP